MDSISLKAFCQQEGITALSNVRINRNGYPFVTVLRGNDAENIYFSKRAAENVNDGQSIATIAKDLLVCETVNANGEARTKLSFTGGNYLDVSSLF